MATPRRSKRLHVLRKHVDNEPQPMWMPREGLPAGGRDECRHGERPCPYVKCKYHLWLTTGNDQRGYSFNGKPLPSKLYPRWLEYPTPPSCALDIAEQQRLVPLGEVANALNLKEWRTRKIIQRALAKLKILKAIKESESDE